MSIIDQQFKINGDKDITLGKQDYMYMFELQKLPQKVEEMPTPTNKYSGCLYTTDGAMVCPKGDKNAWSVTKEGYSVYK
jgi:hypothetical protein